MTGASAAPVCAFCGQPALAGAHVCQDCALGEELPPCIGAAYRDKLNQQFAEVFVLGEEA